MNDKHKHLEFIQQTILRLADNSFRLKQWSVLLVAATLALLSQQPTSTGWVGFIPLIPVLVFWGLDGYFLWQERLYRKLYNQVRILNENEIDFSMNTYHFQTNPKTFLSMALRYPFQNIVSILRPFRFANPHRLPNLQPIDRKDRNYAQSIFQF